MPASKQSGGAFTQMTLLEPAELEALNEDYRDAQIAFEAALEAGAAELLP